MNNNEYTAIFLLDFIIFLLGFLNQSVLNMGDLNLIYIIDVLYIIKYWYL